MPVKPVLLALFAGIVIGPFLGVLVDRLHDRVAVAFEHRCTSCSYGLSQKSLVPVWHWWQNCPSCQQHKGVRYIAVDVSTICVFGLLATRFGFQGRLVPYLGLGAVLVVLSIVDFETHLLPNVVVWPSIWLSLGVILLSSRVLDGGGDALSALTGAAVFGGFIGLSHLIYQRGMGRGDVKLALLLGLFIGWLQPGLLIATRLVLYTILGSLVGGAALGSLYNVIRRRGRAEIPFGPALAGASLVMILLSSVFV